MSEGNRVPDIEPPGQGADMREFPNSNAASSGSSGCGCLPMAPAAAAAAAAMGNTAPVDPSITISITPTTGGQFDLTVDKNESVESLKKIISKRLKVAKERICLLHRERFVLLSLFPLPSI